MRATFAKVLFRREAIRTGVLQIQSRGRDIDLWSIDDQPISLRDISISRVIDSGAHGTVFEGTEAALERKVAVKVWYRPVIESEMYR